MSRHIEQAVAIVAHMKSEVGKMNDMTAPVPAPDREALAVVLHDAVCRDRCEPQAMEEYYRQADRILTRWRLVPMERDLPGPNWDDPDNPKIARGSASARHAKIVGIDYPDDDIEQPPWADADVHG